MLDHVQRGRIEPLQVVEEQSKGMLWSGEHAQKSPKDQLESSLRVLRRQLRHRRLLTDDELKLRNQIHHQLTARTQRLLECVTPSAELGIALYEKRTNQTLKCLSERG